MQIDPLTLYLNCPQLPTASGLRLHLHPLSQPCHSASSLLLFCPDTDPAACFSSAPSSFPTSSLCTCCSSCLGCCAPGPLFLCPAPPRPSETCYKFRLLQEAFPDCLAKGGSLSRAIFTLLFLVCFLHRSYLICNYLSSYLLNYLINSLLRQFYFFLCLTPSSYKLQEGRGGVCLTEPGVRPGT